jgi:Arylsulfotransferase (ASST)
MQEGSWSRRAFVRGSLAAAAAGIGALNSGTDAYASASPSVITSATTDAGANPPGDVAAFVTRPDLRPPRIEITQSPAAQRVGAELPYFAVANEGNTGDRGLMLLDRSGDLVWFRPVSTPAVKNLNVQIYRGKPVLTWWEGTQVANGCGVGTSYLCDGSYDVIATVNAGDGLATDFHELNLTSRGTALVTAYRTSTADLSELGGPPQAAVQSGVAQEIDIATGAVVFQWDSLDHVPVTETFIPLASAAQKQAAQEQNAPFDYFHINSIGVADDGDLLISARNTCTVYKVDRTTGAVRWRLGGRNSDFTMGPGTTFWWQHDVRAQDHSVQGASVLSVFDDGAWPSREPQSRGLLLNVDASTGQCSLLRAYTSPFQLQANNRGSMQVLPDGSVLIGWGSEPYFSEFTASGQQVLSARLPHGDSLYRVFAVDWTGTPDGAPAVVARPAGSGGTVVYMSWNGATEVASWQVSAGSGPSSLRPAGQGRKDGFETAILVGDDGPYFSVAALDADGRELRRSATVRREE